MAQGAFKLPGGRQEEQDTCPKEQPIKVAAQVISYPEVAPALETGPTTRWVGLEMLVDVILEGCKVLTLADSGRQVITMMLEFIQEWGYLVLLLDKLVNYPLHLVGLSGHDGVAADESSTGEASGGQDVPTTDEIVVELKDNVHVGSFQTEILKGRAAKAPTHHTHVMIMPIRCTEVEGGKACPLPAGLQVLHAYTMLTAGSKHVLIVV